MSLAPTNLLTLLVLCTALWYAGPSLAAPAGSLGSTIEDLIPDECIARLNGSKQPGLTPALLLNVELTTIRTMAILARRPYQELLEVTQFRAPSQSNVKIEAGPMPGRDDFEVRYAMWALHDCYNQNFLSRFSLDMVCLFFNPRVLPPSQALGVLGYKSTGNPAQGVENITLPDSSDTVVATPDPKLTSRATAKKRDDPETPDAVFTDDDVNATPRLQQTKRGGIRLFDFGGDIAETSVFMTSWGAILDRAAKDAREDVLQSYRTRPMSRTRGHGYFGLEIEYHPLPGERLTYGILIESLSLIPQAMIDKGRGWHECSFSISENDLETGAWKTVGQGYLRN